MCGQMSVTVSQSWILRVLIRLFKVWNVMIGRTVDVGRVGGRS
jgi:hypothetical protein